MIVDNSESVSLTPDSDAIVLLPVEILFFEKLTAPVAIADNEIADFVELTLEEKSPFPLRDLCFGYLYDPIGREVLIYAAIRRRLEQMFQEAFTQARFVLPGFCLLTHLPSHANSTVVLHYNNTTSTVQISPHGLPIPFDEQTTITLQNPVHLQLDNFDWTKDGSLIIHFSTSDDADDNATPQHYTNHIKPAALWVADVRDAEFKVNERRRRNRERNLLQAIILSAWVTLFLIVGQVGLWGFDSYIKQRVNKRTFLQPAVLTIQDRHSLLTTLEQVTAAELRPLDVLEAMNRLRPDAIYFTEMRAEAPNRITVEGIAATVNALNSYAEALKLSGDFRVNDPRTLVRAGRTTFTLTLDYIGPLPVFSRTNQLSGGSNLD
jgi:hypothetical protein